MRVFDGLAHDVRFTTRTLLRSPGYSAVAVLTLALAIGANTAVFSVLNSLLLRPLAVRAPHRLVTISSDTAISRGFTAGAGWNYAMWTQLTQRMEAFDGACAWSTRRFNLAPGGEMQPVDGAYGSGGFFSTVGVSAVIGRTFSADDDARGGGPDGPVAVISYGLWQRRFGGAASVIGTRLPINGVTFTIIGVTPPEFSGIEVGRALDVILPLGTEPLMSGRTTALDQPRILFLIVMLRLKPGQSLNAATATLRALQPYILQVFPGSPPAFLREPFTLVPAATGTSGAAAGMPGLRQRYERSLLTILGVVGIVLLIACVNLANLLLARTMARRHELAVRLALGAPRWRVARQLLADCLVLSGIGALAGLLFATWSARALAAQLSTPDARVVLGLPLDWRVLAFTAAVTIATAVLFGAAPALRAARAAPFEALQHQGRTTWGVTRSGASSGLVVAQLAISLILVVAAALLVQTFGRLRDAPLGFDRDRVLLVNVDTARRQIDPADRLVLYQRLVAAVVLVPGVADAAGSMWTPGGGGGFGLIRDARGRAVDARQVVANFITSGWFAAYGIPIRAGRDIAEGDTANASPVVVVNDAFERRFLPNRTAIGETFVDPDSAILKGRTVVGVVGDVVYGSPRDPAPPTIYVPLAQSVGLEPPGRTTVAISVRPIAGPPASLARSVAAALTSVDRDLAFTFRPLADQVSASLTEERLSAMLSGFFGALALSLAGLGLYGVTSHSVSHRRTEIGIRTALGARRSDVINLVLGRSIAMIAIGLVAGLAGAAAVTRYLEGMLFGVTPLNPATFIAVPLALAGVSTLAALIPALRATSVDPLIALRSE